MYMIILETLSLRRGRPSIPATGTVARQWFGKEENAEVVAIEPQESIEPRKSRVKRRKASRKPAPPGWFLVPDSGSGHSYFWNVNTNQVSWLHPEDPEADVTMPASWKKPTEDETTSSQPTPMDEDSPSTEKQESKPKLAKNVSVGKHPSLMKAKRDKEKFVPYKNRKDRKGGDEADPMDPSSYSDAPKGNWSSGLVTSDEAKTGVDTTANGPLFQQRPYPSPGDILRRNQAAKKS